MQMSGCQILEKEQYKGIHDVLHDQGFGMHYRVISNTVSQFEVFRCETTIVRESMQQSKKMD